MRSFWVSAFLAAKPFGRIARRCRGDRPIAAALGCFVLIGCENAPVAPVRPATHVPVTAAVSNTIDRDVSVSFPGCDGDVLSGTATEHTVFSSSTDGAGRLHINYKDQLIMRLTSSTSGASYIGSAAATEDDYISDADVLSGVVMKNFAINLIGQGPAPNLRLAGVTRIVISANGIERLFTDTFSAICR